MARVASLAGELLRTTGRAKTKQKTKKSSPDATALHSSVAEGTFVAIYYSIRSTVGEILHGAYLRVLGAFNLPTFTIMKFSEFKSSLLT